MMLAALCCCAAPLNACNRPEATETADETELSAPWSPIVHLLDMEEETMVSLARTRNRPQSDDPESDRRLVRRRVHEPLRVDDERVLVMADDEQLVRWRISPGAVDRWTLGHWTPVYRSEESHPATETRFADAAGRDWSLTRQVVHLEDSTTVERTLLHAAVRIRESLTFHRDGRYEERIEVERDGHLLVEHRVPIPALGSGRP